MWIRTALETTVNQLDGALTQILVHVHRPYANRTRNKLRVFAGCADVLHSSTCCLGVDNSEPNANDESKTSLALDAARTNLIWMAMMSGGGRTDEFRFSNSHTCMRLGAHYNYHHCHVSAIIICFMAHSMKANLDTHKHTRACTVAASKRRHRQKPTRRAQCTHVPFSSSSVNSRFL